MPSAGTRTPAPTPLRHPAHLCTPVPLTTTPSPPSVPGEQNASDDLWFDADRDASGQSRGTEIMIWVDHRGPGAGQVG